MTKAYYGGSPPSAGSWERERHKLVARAVSAAKPNMLLDVGCGRGWIGHTVAPFVGTYYGIDSQPNLVELASKRVPNSVLSVGRAEHLFFPNEFFDCVVCSNVLEHVPDWQAAIEEIARVCKPNGTIVLTVPNKNNPFSIARKILKGSVTWQQYDEPIPKRELLDCFVANGLAVEEFFDFVFVPPKPWMEKVVRALCLDVLLKAIGEFGLLFFIVLNKTGES